LMQQQQQQRAFEKTPCITPPKHGGN